MVSDDPKKVSACVSSGINPFKYSFLNCDNEDWEDLQIWEILKLVNK